MSYIDDMLGAHGYPPDDDNYEVLIGIRMLHQTSKAILIQHKNRQAWFPRAVIYTIEKDALEYKVNFDPAWKVIAHRVKSIVGDF